MFTNVLSERTDKREKGGISLKAIRVGLLGLGTVGSGVVKIIQDHQDKLTHQVGCPVTIQKVLVKDKDKKRDVELSKDVLTTEAYDVIQDPEVDVIIEVIGGSRRRDAICLTRFRRRNTS